MSKTPLVLLVILLIALTVGGIALWQSDLDKDLKIILTLIDAILWFAASLALMVNVFFLDKHGRIPYNSLAWKYFSLFYRDRDADGNWAVSMPDKIKTCPMYWYIVFGIFLSFGALVVGSFPVYLFYHIVILFADGMRSTSGFIVDMFLWVFIVMFFVSVYKSIVPRKTNKFWSIYLGVAFLVMLILVAGFMISSAFASEATTLFGFIIVGALAGLIVLAVLLTILFLAVIFIFGRLRQTLFGQLVGSLYGNLCPVIPVEPAPKK